MPRPCHPVPGRPVQAAVLQGSCAGERLLVVCFRSYNYAAVLRLQNTQPKDRRIYTALTGILAERRASTGEPGGYGRRTA